MKRTLIIIGAILVVLILVAGGVIGAAFMGRKPQVDGMEVGGARTVMDGFAGVEVIPVGGNGVMLVDAGNDTEGTAVLAELSRRGLGPDAVRAIVLTHGHPDHIGAVRLFPKAEVMALQREVALVEGREGAKGPLNRLMPVSATGIKVTRPLQDGEVVMVGDVSVQVFAVPGHTAGSAAYLIGGNLFVGDSADATSDGTLRGSPWIFSDSQAENRASLVRLDQTLHRAGSQITAIVPAHSGALTDGLAQLDAFAAAQQQ